MSNSIIESVVAYFMACPLLKDGAFRVDAMGPEGVEYSVDVGITTPILKQYVNGSSIRQYQFVFASREAYSLDRLQNISNSTFYEELCDWIETQNRSGTLPELPDGCEAQKLEALTPGYLFDADMTNARYQVQLQLTFFKEV